MRADGQGGSGAIRGHQARVEHVSDKDKLARLVFRPTGQQDGHALRDRYHRGGHDHRGDGGVAVRKPTGPRPMRLLFRDPNSRNGAGRRAHGGSDG